MSDEHQAAMIYIGIVEDYLSEIDEDRSGEMLITLGMAKPLIDAMKEDHGAAIQRAERAERERDDAVGAMGAQDERERVAGELCGVNAMEHGCDWPNAVAERLVQRTMERNAALALLHRLREYYPDVASVIEQLNLGPPQIYSGHMTNEPWAEVDARLAASIDAMTNSECEHCRIMAAIKSGSVSASLSGIEYHETCTCTNPKG